MGKKASNQTWALTIFAIGVFMAALDNGIISAALTTINDAFDVSANWGAWGITLYTLGLAISVPIVGKFSDRFGRKKLFIIEITIFGLGSLAVALSPNFTVYLISRFIQSMGGGGIFIIGSSHVLSTMPVEKQGKALGLLGGMNGVAAVIGPNLGSMILDLTGNWHFLFLINVPIAIILLLLGIFKIEETKEPNTKKLDFLGTVLLSLSILGIMYGITNLEGEDIVESFLQPEVYGFITAGIILFIGLLFYESRLEKRDGDPILPFSLLSESTYLLTLLIGFLAGGLMAAMVFIPAFSQQVIGISQENAGYWMTPLAIASGFGAAMGGSFADKRGPIFAVFASAIISGIGFYLFPLWAETRLTFVLSSIVAGFGMGIILGAPLNMLATELVKEKGSALATLSLTRQVGMTLAPTIYAGFITRAFNKMPNLMEEEFPSILKENLEKENVDPNMMNEFHQMMPNTGSMDMDTMMGQIENIPDPSIKEAIENSINQVVQMAADTGYSGLFMSAVVISALIFVVTFILAPLRKKKKGLESDLQ